MGFLGQIQRVPPPTSTDLVKKQVTSAALDLEKSHVRGNELESTIQPHVHRVLPDTERKVVGKMDFRIVPLVTAFYVLAFLDRSNIGKYVLSEPMDSFLDQILSLEACYQESVLSESV